MSFPTRQPKRRKRKRSDKRLSATVRKAAKANDGRRAVLCAARFLLAGEEGGGLLRERLFPASCGKCGLPICKLLPAPPLPQFIRKSLVPGAVRPLPLRRTFSEAWGANGRLFPASCGYRSVLFSVGRRNGQGKENGECRAVMSKLANGRACPRKYTIFGGAIWLLMQRECLRR